MTWRPFRAPSFETDSHNIKNSLAQVTKKLGASPPDVISTVFDGWEELVGEQVAAVTMPESLVKGVLTVVVTDQVWMSRLKWMTPKVAKSINDRHENAVVERVELRIRRPIAPT